MASDDGDTEAGLEEELDALYARPLDQFVPTRNELAARLRKAGERETAAQVKALAKPTVSAWAVNQLLRFRREDFEALLAAGDRLREAQQDVLAGKGTERFAAATEAEREAVVRLVAAARELLENAGNAASDATVGRIAGTLHALADPAAREELDGGRLGRDLDPAGFGSLGGFAPAAPRAEQPPRDELAERRLAKAEQEAAEAAAEERELGRAADEAEGRAADARRAADKAAETARQARARAERAAARVGRARADLDRARRRAERGRRS